MAKATNVLVFAGTTEGRNISEYLAERGVNVTASVATEYGSIVMRDMRRLQIHIGRLDAGNMKEFIKPYELVIDATHPYADVVTHNITDTCKAAGKQYIRLIRPPVAYGGAIIMADAKAAAEYLGGTSGNILITTGNKELAAFTGIDKYKERCFVRVLPTVESIKTCNDIGLKGKNIICMQGPFSHRMNVAMIKELDAKYLVTKDSGEAGGIYEKLSAAKETGITAVLISRPTEEIGLEYTELVRVLNGRFGIKEENCGYFPLFIDIKGKSVIVIGGGKIAARRVEVLLRFGAVVTVVAPEISGEMQALFDFGSVRWEKRKYENGDIAGAALVICAANDRCANSEAAAEAREKCIPVSVADKKSEGTCYFPAIVEGGGVIGGLISTGGGDHRLVKEKAERIRRVLNEPEN